MNTKSLRFGKAMSAALFVLLLSVAGMKNAFAQTQVATLQHGDSITPYYGVNALINANAAAVNGDIITLSSGTFYGATSLTKSITLRGAGVVTDTVAGTYPTIIASDGGYFYSEYFYVYASNCTIEGIEFNVDICVGARYNNNNGTYYYTNTINPRFYKCNISSICTDSRYTASKMTNGQFVNCKISSFDCTETYNTQIINSVVESFSDTDQDYFVDVVNSIIKSGSLRAIYAVNSIICGLTSSSTPDYSCSFINCIGIKRSTYNPFGSGFTENCTTYTSYAAVFESFNGTFSFDESYNLTEAIATGFLGDDGTQVGIYGGYVPYNPRPSYMVIRQCNVAKKSNIEGKLSVEIEVINSGE